VKQAVVDRKGRVNLRLSGTDAPELHYCPEASVKSAKQSAEQRKLYLEWNRDYRQPLAETAVVKLVERLGSKGTVLECEARASAELPNDLFDCYGRFVGDLFVKQGGEMLHVNRWLLEEGLVFPSLYNSMSREEIEGIVAAANRAYSAKKGIWRNLVDCVGELDWGRVYRGLRAPALDDTGDVALPKLFRRKVAWSVNRRAKMGDGSFPKYLRNTSDRCFARDDFLSQGPAAIEHSLADFVADDGRVTVWPEELVFKELPSNVVGPDGMVLAAW
jgi:endonuclease YncB( thermonuclease family)